MKIAAVYKLNDRILKTTNLDKKISKLKDVPEILYKKENGTESDLDIWIKDNISHKEDKDEEEIKLYHYINKETGYSITSIYDNLKEDGFEKID